jgi:hypothetical protein
VGTVFGSIQEIRTVLSLEAESHMSTCDRGVRFSDLTKSRRIRPSWRPRCAHPAIHLARVGFMERSVTMSDQVEYPILRRNLKEAAWCLSDVDYQARVWGDPTKPPPDNMFPFGEAVAYVLDDMAPDLPSGLLGQVLINERELTTFSRLVESLKTVMARIGTRGSFSDASTLPQWEDVRSAARALHQELERGDAKS